MNKKDIPFEKIQRETLEIARCEFRQWDIYKKAFSSLLLGFLTSLVVCPQFGLGIPKGHGIAHIFWTINPLLCALFCGLFFYSSGALAVFITLNQFERRWFVHKSKGIFLALPMALWCTFMLFPQTTYISVSYSLFWGLGFWSMWRLSKLLMRRPVSRQI